MIRFVCVGMWRPEANVCVEACGCVWRPEIDACEDACGSVWRPEVAACVEAGGRCVCVEARGRCGVSFSTTLSLCLFLASSKKSYLKRQMAPQERRAP